MNRLTALAGGPGRASQVSLARFWRSKTVIGGPERRSAIDLLVGAGLIALITALHADLLVSATSPLGMDTATFFYPWYGFLGEQLRSGQLPLWNPHLFSGTPFAGDPESGWMYLPAMAFFSVLPLPLAAKANIIFHLALAGGTTFSLARTLGASLAGSLLAGLAYAHSGFLNGHAVCCFAYASVAAWLPLLLLGAERAIHAADWRGRGVWWGVAGLAFSQILSAWLGQGSYYAALVLGGFLAVRTMCAGRRRAGIALGLQSLMVNGGGIALFGMCLAAAGLVPRVEANLLSNLPGGYPQATAIGATVAPDWGIIDDWPRRLLQPGFSYPGWTTLGLALAALPLARQRHGAPFFVGLSLVTLILGRAEPGPLHALFGLLPGFDRIHARSPERVLMVFYLGPALLAGIALTRLQRLPRRAVARAMLAILAVAAVCLDLHLAWLSQSTESRRGGGDYQFADVDLTAYYAPTPAARWLQAKAASEHFRYLGHAEHVFGGAYPYTLHWADPAIGALEVNNRAVTTGLDDVQGYDPIHLARYDAFIAALNGSEQNYHHADVLPNGLDSPLLDLLNVRYVVVPSTTAADQLSPRFERPLQVAYADSQVSVLSNPTALPRAWLVHAARQATAAEALRLLASGAVDPRTTAVLEEPLPSLEASPEPAADHVVFERYAPDHLQLQTSSATNSLLVLSEAYYPAWEASIDGASTRVFAADGALRAVALPPGEHHVELRYTSVALTASLTLSAVAAAIWLLLLLETARRDRFARRQTPQRVDAGAAAECGS